MTATNSINLPIPISVANGGSGQATVAAARDAFLISTATTKNIVIGGDFSTNPWQRSISITAAPSISQAADQWIFVYNTTTFGRFNYLKQADGPTVAQSGVYSPFCMRFAVNATQGAIATGDLFFVRQPIEGPRWKLVTQRNLTLSFWVKGSTTGIYCVTLANNAGDNCITFEYTINAADTWEFKTINIPASPSSGTWNYGVGENAINLTFILAAGSTYFGAPGSWQNTLTLATSNQTNLLATGGNYIQFDLVQLEVGDVATPFEQRYIHDELTMCQRFYEKSYLTMALYNTLNKYAGNVAALGEFAGKAAGYGVSTVRGYAYVHFMVTKAKIPTVNLYTSAAGVLGSWLWGGTRVTTVLSPYDETVGCHSTNGFYCKDTVDTAPDFFKGQYIADGSLS